MTKFQIESKIPTITNVVCFYVPLVDISKWHLRNYYSRSWECSCNL